MHPNRLFHWDDRDAIRDFVRQAGFGALFAATPDGPRVAHLPVVWLNDDTLGFHLSRGNGLTRHLDGATGLFTVQGPDAYVSPDWYGLGPDQVPTWNYVAVELEGRVAKMDRDALVAQIDALSHEQESRLAPKLEWTRAKTDPKKIEMMLNAIKGFTLEVQAWRGTLKLGQNKPQAAREYVAHQLDTLGRRAVAHWMRHAK
jgi:transcriptional regulator